MQCNQKKKELKMQHRPIHCELLMPNCINCGPLSRPLTRDVVLYYGPQILTQLIKILKLLG
jgi:hypothetical protein